MRRYFFHTDGDRGFRDQVGTLLPDDDAARVEAARVLGQLVNEKPTEVWRGDDLRITVTDEAGLILFTIDITAVAAPAARPARPKSTGREET